MTQEKSGLPFRAGDSVALAYVSGRYAPPGPKLGPVGRLGMYVAMADLSLSFWTFGRSEKFLAYAEVTSDELNVEFALIRGWLAYGVPFDQWRMYRVGEREGRTLQRQDFCNKYEQARQRLGKVLFEARAHIYLPQPKLKPMFAIRPRSDSTIKRDVAERDQVMRSIGWE